MKCLFNTLLGKTRGTLQHASIALFSLLGSNSVLADLPKMEDPSRGAGKGIIDTIKNYAYDGGILAGLLVAAYAFYQVAASCISTYKEISDGKKKWGDLGMMALVGAILLVVIIWLLTKAAEIL